jgi:hypothetical protein
MPLEKYVEYDINDQNVIVGSRYYENVFGEEYLIYKSKVNCCIPWFPYRTSNE